MKKTLFLFVLLVSILISCEPNSLDSKAEYFELANDYDGNGYFYGNANNVAETFKEETVSIINRKLIKNGSVTFETSDLKATKSRIDQLVKKHQAYFSKESENEIGNRINVHLTIRVPAKRFDSLLNDISQGVEKFDYKQIKIKDVTEEFLDLETRLKNKKELEQRYIQILKKAKNVKEILEVEKEIGKLREDIESAEGRLKYLKDQVSVSTLEVSFYKEVYSETGFGKKVKDSFKDGFGGLKSLSLFLISVWPFLIIGVVLWLWLRKRFKRKKKH